MPKTITTHSVLTECIYDIMYISSVPFVLIIYPAFSIVGSVVQNINGITSKSMRLDTMFIVIFY